MAHKKNVVGIYIIATFVEWLQYIAGQLSKSTTQKTKFAVTILGINALTMNVK